MKPRLHSMKRCSIALGLVTSFTLVLISLLTWNLSGRTQKVYATSEPVNVYLTTADQNNKLTPQSGITFSNGSSGQSQLINVNENTKDQQIVGFGGALNDATVWEMENEMSQSQRDALMQSFFSPTNGIGISMLRQPIGQSDLNAPGYQAPGQYCSYDDNGGTPDPNLANFSIQHDINSHAIDLIHQAQQLNPQLTVMASTWCVPQWMLQSSGGVGNLQTMNPSYYQTYANYLVKFIQAYGAQNIPIWAITPQNEPEHGTSFNDNLTADQENTLIKTAIGPTFTSNGIGTKILALDHDWSYTSYAETILGDQTTSQYVSGTAWHPYTGNVSGQTVVHDAYPRKGTYFDEDSAGQFNTNWPQDMPYTGSHLIETLRDWSSTYIQWTLALSTTFTPGSCSACGATVYVDNSTGNVTYSLDYYLLGHVSKFVKPGAYRIDSNDTSNTGLENVAFINPDGSKALVAYNNNSSSQSFGVNWGNEHFDYTLPSQAIATFTWSGNQTTQGPNLVQNPGFETGDLTDWNVYVPSGQSTSNAFVEQGGHSGNYRLAEYNGSSAFSVSVYQCFSNITPGTYQATAWVEGSGSQDMAIYNQAGGTVLAKVSTAPDDYNNWHQISVSASITGGQPCLAFETTASAGSALRVDDVSFSSNLVQNPGFETGDLTNWNVYVPSGQSTSNAFVEPGGHSGNYRLAEYNGSSAFSVSVFQTFSNIPNGTYTLTGWIEGSGQSAMQIRDGSGGNVLDEDTISSSVGNWQQFAISATITGGQADIEFDTTGSAGDYLRVDDVSFTLQ